MRLRGQAKIPNIINNRGGVAGVALVAGGKGGGIAHRHRVRAIDGRLRRRRHIFYRHRGGYGTGAVIGRGHRQRGGECPCRGVNVGHRGLGYGLRRGAIAKGPGVLVLAGGDNAGSKADLRAGQRLGRLKLDFRLRIWRRLGDNIDGVAGGVVQPFGVDDLKFDNIITGRVETGLGHGGVGHFAVAKIPAVIGERTVDARR